MRPQALNVFFPSTKGWFLPDIRDASAVPAFLLNPGLPPLPPFQPASKPSPHCPLPLLSRNFTGLGFFYSRRARASFFPRVERYPLGFSPHAFTTTSLGWNPFLGLSQHPLMVLFFPRSKRSPAQDGISIIFSLTLPSPLLSYILRLRTISTITTVLIFFNTPFPLGSAAGKSSPPYLSPSFSGPSRKFSIR